MSLHDYQPIVQAYAAQYKVPVAFVNSVIRAESGGNPNARSPAGAGGLGQLMPGTARGLGVRNVFDPKQNIMGTTKMLGNLMRSYHGDLRKTLAAYNAGPGAVKRYGGVPPYAETQQYIKRVLGYYNATGKAGVPPPTQNAAGVPSAAPASMPTASAAPSVAKQFLITSLFDDNPMLQSAILNHQQNPSGAVQTSAVLPAGVRKAVAAPGVRGELVAAAASQVGKTANDAMRYIKAAGGSGHEAWCGDFVQWVFKQRGLAVPPARYVPGLLTWAKKNNRYTNKAGKAQAGDMVMFDWNHDGKPDHVELLVGRKGNALSTIGGNTSMPGGGIGVARKQRSMADVLGFALGI